MRKYICLIHRYVGLLMVIFLLIAGLTGSILVWYHELDAQLNAQWMKVEAPSPDAQPLDFLVLHAQLKERYPEAWINYVALHHRPGEAQVFSLEGGVDYATGEHIDLPHDEIFVNPYTGDVLGARKWGAITEGLHNLLPFIYKLHYSLALDDLGMLLMGIIAVLWTIDCFVGAYLTLPASSQKQSISNGAMRCRNFGKRWWPAWKIRWKASTYKLNFDFHRAGGLWFWGVLFVLAWSSVAFNLKEVYHPVMQAVFTLQPDQDEVIPKLPVVQTEPGISWPAALEIARGHMENLAQAKGFSIHRENSLSYNPYTAMFRYQVLSDRDLGDDHAGTNLFFDANSGQLAGSFLPTGEASGDTVTSWLIALHVVAIWGMPFKLFMTLTGGVIAILSITGLYIWWRKRKARQVNQLHRLPSSPDV